MKQFHLNQDSMTEETLVDSIILFECNPVWHLHFIGEMQVKQFFSVQSASGRKYF